MRLAPFIQRRCLCVVAHPHRSGLMDDVAGSMKAPFVPLIVIIPMRYHGPHRMQDLAEGLVHVLRLFDLVLRMAGIELQYGNAIFVDYLRIYLAIVLPVSHGLAAPGHMNGSAEQ